MNKKHVSLSIISFILLTMLLICLSFAWYQAEIINNAVELASEGITITFNDSSSNRLTPDVLKEGVYNGIPNDYATNKNTYCITEGNTLYFQEFVKVKYVKYDTLTFNVTLNYKGLTEEVDALNYLNITVYKSVDEVTINSYVPVGEGISLNNTPSVNKSVLGDGEYYLIFAVSYKLPDEMLPADLINSDVIILNISATLS